MRDLNESTITSEVIARLRGAANARTKQVSEALVRHLHAFVREIEPTQDEWMYGIEFLTRVGQLCDAKRQEFILLSDTLGVSMLVDAINHRMPAGATETTVFGPFFAEARREFPLGANISPDAQGTPLFVHGTVSDVEGTPIAGASVDVWHSDGDGYYDLQVSDELTMRGRFTADNDGCFWLWTIRPSSYPIPDDGPVGDMLRAQGRHPYRPEHVHFMISAPGFETLVTHVFADGDKYLDSDAVFGVKNSLIKTYKACLPGTAPDGTKMAQNFVELNYDFKLKRTAP